ncbi:MAG: cation transporter [Deltaproteobacteria bacterium]|nr:cation transporter [Deltaproteobacteria bacterium]
MLGHDHSHGGDGHGHLHDHASGEGQGTSPGSVRRMALSLGLTAAIMLVEAVGGWLSGSLALLSDAGHMLTDAGSLGLSLLALLFAARPADPRRTFGFRRAEVLAAQINVAALLALAAFIGWEALERLRAPPPTIQLGLMAGVAALGLLGNGVILWTLHGERGINVRSAFAHVLSDTVSSLAVLAGAGAMALAPSLAWLDPVLSLLIAALILWGGVRLLREVADILMEAVPGHLRLDEVCRAMRTAEGVREVHDVHIWTISSGLYALSAHLVIQAQSMGRNDEILHDVKSRLSHGFGIEHTTLQIESAEYDHRHEVHTH